MLKLCNFVCLALVTFYRYCIRKKLFSSFSEIVFMAAVATINQCKLVLFTKKSSGISSMASIAGIASMATSSSWETGGADPTSGSLLRRILQDR